MDDFAGLLATATTVEIEIMIKELRQIFPCFQKFTDQEIMSLLIRIRCSLPPKITMYDIEQPSALTNSAARQVLDIIENQLFLVCVKNGNIEYHK